MNINFSREGQDLFVLSQLNKKQNGFFVEIGTAMPIENNNTYLFEKYYNWTGILIELDTQYASAIRHHRTSTFLNEDATKIDYRDLFLKLNMPKRIDYLSLDIDPPTATLEALKRLPLDIYSFSCVTFEHDRYWFGDSVANESRDIFLKNGYTLFLKDAPCVHGPFEDWYIKEL